MNRAAVSAPNDSAKDGSWAQRVKVRELNGYDERFIAERRGLPPFAVMKALLERVVAFHDGAGSSAEEKLGRLTIGDCVELVLLLRKATLGERLACELSCPKCGGAISVDVSVNALMNRSRPGSMPDHTVRIGNFLLELRPTTARDVEALLSSRGAPDLVERLVRSCVVSCEPPLPERLTHEFLDEIASKLSELDTGAETILEMSCPTCSHPFKVPFAVEDFFLQEMEARQAQLEREVHLLALNYHWSEDAILSMPSRRRKQYVELISSDLYGEDV